MSEAGIVDKAAADTAAADAAVAAATGKAADTTKAADAANGVDKAVVDAGKDQAAADAAAWTDKWREAIAGEDPDALRALKRFKDPASLWNKIQNQEKVISQRAKGAIKPGETATPDEIAAWRAEVGLPAEPKGFIEALKFPDGRVLGDDDKPVAESFAKAILDAGDPTPQGMFTTALDWYNKQVEEAATLQQEGDIDSKVECQVALQKEFGSKREVERAFKHIEIALFDDAPEGLADTLFRGARGPDGKLLGNDPVFIGWLSSLARKSAPIEEVMPVGGNVGGQGRLAEIRSWRDASDQVTRDKYWNSPAVQAEERTLIDAELKAKQRGQKAA